MTQHHLSIRQALASDHAYARDLAMTRPWWWPQWLPWNSRCKRYTVLLVGNDTEFAKKYSGRTTFCSVIRQDPAHIDTIVFEEAANALKEHGIHITNLDFHHYLPSGGLEPRIYGQFTITIFGV